MKELLAAATALVVLTTGCAVQATRATNVTATSATLNAKVRCKPGTTGQAWWELRQKYQGVAAPLARTEEDFDPGAKYHVPANVPYTRYFLADILQFQFHRALAKASGCSGPLNRCSIYGNQAAGKKLGDMLAMGCSRPWPDALEALTGQRQMDATAILDYFAPLQKWLDQQNQGKPVGW